MDLSTFAVQRFAVPANIEWQDKPYSFIPGATYWDFVINGTPLGNREDMVSCLAWYGGPIRKGSVRRLLLELKPDALEGRTTLYIRYDCDPPYPPYGGYDTHCEVVSAIVEREANTVVWRDFLEDLGENSRGQAPRVTPLEWGPYKFDWSEYAGALGALLEAPVATRDTEEASWWKIWLRVWRR